MVYYQLDKKKERKVSVEQLQGLLTALKYSGDSAAALMKMLDTDGDGFIDEQEWLEGLDATPQFKQALEDDIDPETGKLKCMITASKAIFDYLRRQEGCYFVERNEVGRYLKALSAVYKPGDAELEPVIKELLA